MEKCNFLEFITGFKFGLNQTHLPNVILNIIPKMNQMVITPTLAYKGSFQLSQTQPGKIDWKQEETAR